MKLVKKLFLLTLVSTVSYFTLDAAQHSEKRKTNEQEHKRHVKKARVDNSYSSFLQPEQPQKDEKVRYGCIRKVIKRFLPFTKKKKIKPIILDEKFKEEVKLALDSPRFDALFWYFKLPEGRGKNSLRNQFLIFLESQARILIHTKDKESIIFDVCADLTDALTPLKSFFINFPEGLFKMIIRHQHYLLKGELLDHMPIDLIMRKINTADDKIELQSYNLSGGIKGIIDLVIVKNDEKPITLLDLSNNKFTESIPAELSNLTHLQELDLSGNYFSGHVPSALHKFGIDAFINKRQEEKRSSDNRNSDHKEILYDALDKKFIEEVKQALALHKFDALSWYLRLPHDQSSNLPRDQFLTFLEEQAKTLINTKEPITFDNIFANPEVSTAFNKFFTTLNESLFKMIIRHQYYLLKKKLLDQIPIDLIMKKINTDDGKIDLQNSNLNGKIKGIIDLAIVRNDKKSITSLNLSCNKFTGSIPIELNNLTHLQELHLNENELTGEIPPQLGDLKELEKLDLSDNYFIGPIPFTLLEFGIDAFINKAKENELDSDDGDSDNEETFQRAIDLSLKLHKEDKKEISGIYKTKHKKDRKKVIADSHKFELSIDSLLEELLIEQQKFLEEIAALKETSVSHTELSKDSVLGSFISKIANVFTKYLKIDGDYSLIIDLDPLAKNYIIMGQYCNNVIIQKQSLVALLEQNRSIPPTSPFYKSDYKSERKARLYGFIATLIHEFGHMRDKQKRERLDALNKKFKKYKKKNNVKSIDIEKFKNKISRKYEFRADAHAALLCDKIFGNYDPNYLAHYLSITLEDYEKIDDHSSQQNQVAQALLSRTHPPMQTRLQHQRQCIERFKNVRLEEIDFDNDLEYESITGGYSTETYL